MASEKWRRSRTGLFLPARLAESVSGVDSPSSTLTGVRTYRGSTRLLMVVTATVGIAAAGLSGQMMFTSWLTAAERIALTATIVGPLGWLLIRAWRSSTTITAEDVVARGLLSTRRVAWGAVQDIRVEANPGAFAAGHPPEEMVVLYLDTGRTLILPHLHQHALDIRRLQLGREVAAVREVWLRGRGPDWVPIPDVLRKAAERSRYGMSSWVIGLIPYSIAMLVMIVVAMLGLLTSIDEAVGQPFSWLFDPLATLVVPAIAYVVGSITSVALRRRGRQVARPTRASHSTHSARSRSGCS